MKKYYLLATVIIAATSFMPPTVYSSWWWISFCFLIASGILFSICRNRLWHRPTIFSLHLSLLLILAGGGLTFFTSERGSLHLLPGVPVKTFQLDDNKGEALLPTALTLKKFEIEYYSGASFPSDFHSYISTPDATEIHISMNNIGKLNGYRFYQSSFDDNGGTILTVVHDVWGIALTYSGFALFFLSGLFYVSHRLKPCKPIVSSSKLAVAVTTMLMLSPLYASAAPAVASKTAEDASARQGVCCGKIIPFATAARDFTLKVTGKDHVSSLSPEQFLLSLAAYPQEWKDVPFIKVDSRLLAEALNISSKYVSPSQLYNEKGEYIPETLFKKGDDKLDKAILKLDEKVALIASLYDGTFFTPLSATDSRLRSEASVNAELRYLRIQPQRLFFILAFCIALAAICLVLFKNTSQLAVKLRYALIILTISGLATFAWQWYIIGFAPLATAPQIMQFTAVCLSAVCSYLVFRRKTTSSDSPEQTTALTIFSGCLLAGVLGFVAWIASKNPQLTPLMPVLNSAWLSLHVSLVMLSYAILGLTFPMAVIALCRKKVRSYYSNLIHNMLFPGVYILALGIISGSLWANVSWGRYWAWDPKETWALVTLLLYALPLHRRQFPEKGFLLYILFCLLSILMTSFGVNHLPSLHAYL